MEQFSFVKRSGRFLKDEQIHQAVELANYSLGDLYTDFDTLKMQSESPYSRVLSLGDSVTDETIGLAVVKVFDALDELLDYTPLDQKSTVNELISSNFRGGKIGYLATMAVDPDFRGHGLGRKLTKMCLEQFSDWGVTSIYSFGWTDHEGCHIQNTLESSGFEVLGFLPGYYRQASIDDGFDCPTCGNPCDCSIKLFEQIL